MLGRAHWVTGNLDAAVAAFEEAIAVASPFAEAGRGTDDDREVALGAMFRAFDHLARLARDNPGRAQRPLDVALLDKARGALRAPPVAYFVARGRVHELAGEYRQAAELYDAARAVDPEDPEPLESLARLYGEKLADREGAYRCFEILATLRPNSLDDLANLAEAALVSGRLEEAQRHGARVAAGPSDVHIALAGRLFVALADLFAGRVPEALAGVERLTAELPAGFEHGWSYDIVLAYVDDAPDLTAPIRETVRDVVAVMRGRLPAAPLAHTLRARFP
jgi:tetratricopeptide (TPR) repeat protein